MLELSLKDKLGLEERWDQKIYQSVIETVKSANQMMSQSWFAQTFLKECEPCERLETSTKPLYLLHKSDSWQL